MIVNLLSEHHLEFLSLKEGCRGSSESTLVKVSNCVKSHATAHIVSGVHFIFVSGANCAHGNYSNSSYLSRNLYIQENFQHL